ncbi:MAG: hypothetical protein HC773_19570 [Scytonema sp. CRU_2_7]|nr:hypothetical protein [Scytonema sp. CRU_2_7]
MLPLREAATRLQVGFADASRYNGAEPPDAPPPLNLRNALAPQRTGSPNSRRGERLRYSNAG